MSSYKRLLNPNFGDASIFWSGSGCTFLARSVCLFRGRSETAEESLRSSSDGGDGEAESRAEDWSWHHGVAGAGVVVPPAHGHVAAGLGRRARRNATLD